MEQTAFITGATRGIGLEIARQLGQKGYHVILSGRVQGQLEQASRGLLKEGIEAGWQLMDVSDPSSIQSASASLKASGTRLDVLVNNAGIMLKKDRQLVSDQEVLLTKTLDTNSYGPLRVTKAFLPLLKKNARVIMMSSSGGIMNGPVPGWSPAYCVSKTLLNALTRQLAHDLQPREIVVNAVCPGWVRTRMGGQGAPLTVSQGADTPVWLATEAPSELTGKFFRGRKEIGW